MKATGNNGKRQKLNMISRTSSGVVWYTLRDFIPGSAQALAELQRRGKQLTFVTNNSITSVEHHLQKLNSQAQLHIEKVGPTPCCSQL